MSIHDSRRRADAADASADVDSARQQSHAGSTLALYTSHGFHVRNLLDTELLELLARRFRVVVLVGSEDAGHLAAEYGSMVEVAAVDFKVRPIERKLEFVRKRLIVKPDRALTTSVFTDSEKRLHPLRHTFLRRANGLLGRSPTIRARWLDFEGLIASGREFDETLRALAPSLVVTANYGTDPGTIRLLRSAERLAIPTLSIVPSFDNLTSKGVMGAKPTRLLVWNETMRREAIGLHDFSAAAVGVCGPVQFDIYAQPERWLPRQEVWRSFGLDAQRPTYVVGTITPVYFPYNRDVIEIVAEAIAAGKLPRDAQVLVRLHPQVVDDPTFGDKIEPYRAIAARYPFVALNVPEVRRWGTLRPPAKDDMAQLATILAGADAVVVPASTLAIDAAAVDSPVIGVAFDGKTRQPPELSSERMFYFTHYRPLTESGAIALARSPEELVASLERATRDRGERAERRRRLIELIVGRHDGGAAQRICAEIEDMARTGVR